MTDNSDTWERIREFNDSVVQPLARDAQFAELCDAIKSKLENERDEDFRFRLLGDLVMYLRLAGKDQASYDWAVRTCEEFDDWPLAWCRMGRWYCSSARPGHPTRTELRTALGHYETALERARASNEWVRSVLFSICRVLTALEDYPLLEARMREILDDLTTTRDVDIPIIERDWLKRVPEGHLDSDLVARYEQLVVADEARMRRLGYKTRPAALEELEV